MTFQPRALIISNSQLRSISLRNSFLSREPIEVTKLLGFASMFVDLNHITLYFFNRALGFLVTLLHFLYEFWWAEAFILLITLILRLFLFHEISSFVPFRTKPPYVAYLLTDIAYFGPMGRCYRSFGNRSGTRSSASGTKSSVTSKISILLDICLHNFWYPFGWLYSLLQSIKSL